ncbi:LCP family protein [Tannockella kyphosi]|uniref:LCP family protein n=1 Tax=Tannockella kyphosi TaxID=2899121 RepID=UPI002011F2AC|nr:LCP family protein [Tannockella kyphosi]
MKKLIKKITSMKVVLCLFLISASLFMYYVFSLQILNMEYNLAVGAVLVFILLISLLIYRSGLKRRPNKSSKRITIVKVMNLLLSVLLLFTSYYLYRGNQFIANVTGTSEELYIITVYALQGSALEEVDDLSDQITGVSYQYDTETITSAVIHFDEIVEDFDYVAYDDYISLTTALYSYDVDTIMIGEEHEQVIEEVYPDFLDETKVIATYELTRETTVTTIPVEVTEESFNVYITGIDSYGSIDTVSRSDVNIIATINPTTKQILLTSIPRDMQITLATSGQMDKLTHAAIYGEDESIATLENFLEIEINYYAKTNFTGIIDIIDALGGLEIDSPYGFTSADVTGNVVIEEGYNLLDGTETLAFVRERSALPSGDYDRARNQQLVIEALVDKVSSATVITEFSSILDAVEDSFKTDLSSNEIKALLNMQLSDMASWEIYSVQVLGDSYKTAYTYSMWGTEIYVTEPYEYTLSAIQELIDRVQNDELITEEDVEGLQ